MRRRSVRFYAHQKAGKTEMKCHVRKGDFLDAFLEALGSNAEHGIPRSNEDKRKAVLDALEENDKNNRGWSNRKIAEFCKVGKDLVNDIVNKKKSETSEVESGFSAKKDSDGGLFDGEQNGIGSTDLEGLAEQINAEHENVVALGCSDLVEALADSLDDEEDSEDEDGEDKHQLFDEANQPVPPQAFAAFNMKSDLRVFLKMLDQAAKKCEEIGNDLDVRQGVASSNVRNSPHVEKNEGQQ
jgi:hypothetical protein